MKSGAITRTSPAAMNEDNLLHSNSEGIGKKFEPQRLVQAPSLNGYGDPWLRMFTEEEVSVLLRVSLSQLRKWRMKKNRGSAQGPPFKKLGRLVRYPGHALRAYINGQAASFQE